MSGYDEFALLGEAAAEAGLALDSTLKVRRVSAMLDDGRTISAVKWGGRPPELVLLHGGGQNAHTWDTVALALGAPLLAPDLPGHGHSDRPAGGDDIIAGYARDLGKALTALAPCASTVIGMSAGGLTGISLVAHNPGRFVRLMLVDVLPGPDPTAAAAIRDFLAGPPLFDSLEDMIARAIAFSPRRTPSSLRRGVMHNAVQRQDGKWQWRHQRHRRSLAELPPETAAQHYELLWQELARTAIPITLVRGMAPGSVVTDAQEKRFRNLRPDARVIRVDGAGHNIQGEKPLELAAHIGEFVT